MSPRLLATVVALLAIPTLAYADALGAVGKVRVLEVNTTSAETYLQYHGRIVVADLKAQTEYRWGGTSCGTRTLDAGDVATLQSVLATGLRVQPRYQNGQGDVKCMVGFLVTE